MISKILLQFANKLTVNENIILQNVVERVFIDVKNGSSATLISDDELDVLLKSNIVGVLSDLSPKPLTIVSLNGINTLSVTKYLECEINIVKKLQLLNKAYSCDSDVYFEAVNVLRSSHIADDMPNLSQYYGIINTLKHQLNVITGGPGTGKTTTVSMILFMLFSCYKDIKIKLSAPTAKAVLKLKDGIDIKNFSLSDENFSTIHRLLGYKNSRSFVYNKYNYLDIDVLIVDEVSMVSLSLFSKLLDAIDINIKHVVFIGDHEQLSAVDTGNVFNNIVFATDNLIKKHKSYSWSFTRLTESKRNSSDIGKLANAIKFNTNIDKTLKSNSIKLYPLKLKTLINCLFYSNGSYLYHYANTIVSNFNINNLYTILTDQSIMCISNEQKFGTNMINDVIEEYIRELIADKDEWYNGRPIMILENDYRLDIKNGDIGIYYKNTKKVVFKDMAFSIAALPLFQIGYAYTIHKTQGSEYKHVNIILDNSSKLTKELIYTAVTRAKESIAIFGSVVCMDNVIDNQRISNISNLLDESFDS